MALIPGQGLVRKLPRFSRSSLRTDGRRVLPALGGAMQVKGGPMLPIRRGERRCGSWIGQEGLRPFSWENGVITFID